MSNEFYHKFNKKLTTPSFMLVTTVTDKRTGGNLSLSSMSSYRVFLDNNVAPTIEYLSAKPTHFCNGQCYACHLIDFKLKRLS
ncbi:unnamed protein product [Brassica rapa]|uniref:Uncharacterized protein n=1 Tax=Brassica campestris TaxID=3711 RepID=A0A3P5Y2T4_BRACM|nr:unnamed protein product [Brassica rapa]VDC61476.1 unnamed protein product [Brassica rapa]